MVELDNGGSENGRATARASKEYMNLGGRAKWLDKARSQQLGKVYDLRILEAPFTRMHQRCGADKVSGPVMLVLRSRFMISVTSKASVHMSNGPEVSHF